MKSSFNVLLSIFLALILVATVVYAVDINPTEIRTSTKHGTSVSGQFVVGSETEVLDFTVKPLIIPITNSALTFSTLDGSPIVFNLSANANKTIKYEITVPQYTLAGNYEYTYSAGNAANNKTGKIIVAVNATAEIDITQAPSDISMGNTNSSLKVKNIGNVQLNNVKVAYNQGELTDSDDNKVTLTFSPASLSLAPGEEKTISITSKFDEGFQIGSNVATLNVTSDEKVSDTTTITARGSLCSLGEKGNMVRIRGIKDLNLDNTDDWEWKPLDEVEIEVKVENLDDDDQDITVELALFDNVDKKFVDIDDPEETVNVNDDDTEYVNLVFTVPADIEENSHTLYVKAYVDGDEDTECVESSQSVKRIEKESRDVVVSNVKVPKSVECNGLVQVEATVYNIGTKDEDEVKVTLYNKDLGLDEESSSFTLDSGDDKKVKFTFVAPKNVSEKNYTLDFTALFNYDEDDDEYNDESEVREAGLSVSGNCGGTGTGTGGTGTTTTEGVEITGVELTSEAKAGEQITIQATLKNTGAKTNTYIVGVEGNEEWSNIDKVDPLSISIEPGQAKTVNVYLTADSSAAGDKTFYVKVVDMNGNSKRKAVVLSIEGKTSGITGGAIGKTLQENWFIWIIILVNVVLIVLIIVVARKISK